MMLKQAGRRNRPTKIDEILQTQNQIEIVPKENRSGTDSITEDIH